MKKYIKITFLAAFTVFLSLPAGAASLDELYRSIIRDDNEGYLPIYVKNRNRPEMLFDDEFDNVLNKPAAKVYDKPEDKPVNLINEQKLKEEAELERIRRWENAVKAVRENRVTPVELTEIENYARQKDPKAVEILAWMNTKGIGVRQDLVKAFHLYREAAVLNVPQAQKNAALIYRAMTRRQRELLTVTPADFTPLSEETEPSRPASEHN